MDIIAIVRLEKYITYFQVFDIIIYKLGYLL